MEIFVKVLKNVLIAIYSLLPFSIVLSVFIMFFYMYAKENGFKIIIKKWWQNFCKNKRFRNLFFLTVYTVMILFKTIFSRNIWKAPINNILGVWGLYNAKGELTTETIENFILFVPFTYMLFTVFKNELLQTKKVRFLNIAVNAIIISFLFSFTIEFLQLFLKIGEFQLSDLFYNSMGGLAGGLIYYIVHKT